MVLHFIFISIAVFFLRSETSEKRHNLQNDDFPDWVFSKDSFKKINFLNADQHLERLVGKAGLDILAF